MNHAELLCNRGVTLHREDRLAEALASYDEALALKPDYAEALYNRGNVLWGLGRFEEALASTDKAVKARPRYVEALYNRGVMLHRLKRPEKALRSLDAALALRPDFVEALNNRGGVFKDLMRFEEALADFERVLAFKPDHAGALNNRGGVFQQLRRHEKALASFDAALAINPRHADALFNRGTALQNLNRFEEALTSYEKVLAFDPGHSDAFSSLAGAALQICDWKLTAKVAATLKEHVVQSKSVVEPLTFMAYCGDDALQRRCAENYVRHHIPVVPLPLWDGTRYRHGKIRIAYLSADFYQHATAILMAELFERHDRSLFDVTSISFSPDDGSAMRARLVNAFDHFHDVRSQSDKEVAKLLRTLEVDIAIDLKGHTKDARPKILSYRPAPVQVSYLGFPGTMGAEFIDYMIADPHVLPFDRQPFFAEKIVYLPDCYQVNGSKRIIGLAPKRAEAGLPENAFVFCSFNNHWKITAPLFDVWMRLLGAIPGSVLWLIGNNESARRKLCAEAQARGIDPQRLVFSDRISSEDHLARHQLADLFLDTLPVNAHTTASDALWAGLPVLTCRGEAFAGRVAASLLHAVGLPELVTHNLEDYETLALKLAQDPSLLQSLRLKLEQNRLTHPLFDTDRFRRNIEAAYTRMWEIAERGEPAQSFPVAPDGGGVP